MAKFLLGFSLLLIAVTGYLGYATKEKVVALQGDLSKTKQNLRDTTAKLVKTEGILKTTADELAATKATLEEREKEITKLKGEVDDITKKLTDATKAVEEKTAALEVAMKEKAILEERFGKFNPEELIAKMNDLTAQVAKLQTELAEAKQVESSLLAQKKDTEDKLVGSQRVVQEYKTGFTRPGLTGTVLAYNAGWNFVVLSVGDKSGIKANAQMLVMRNSQPIAKVKVTTVEPATSIADIVPGTMLKGQSVQPGDTVVLEAKR